MLILGGYTASGVKHKTRGLSSTVPDVYDGPAKTQVRAPKRNGNGKESKIRNMGSLGLPLVCTYHCVLRKRHTTPYTYVARASIRCTHMCYMFIVPEDNICFYNITVSRI